MKYYLFIATLLGICSACEKSTNPFTISSNSTSFSLKATQNGIAAEDIIKFNYNPKDKFISRACGYKTIFDNLTISTANTLNFINNIELITNSISDNNNTHVKILH